MPYPGHCRKRVLQKICRSGTLCEVLVHVKVVFYYMYLVVLVFYLLKRLEILQVIAKARVPIVKFVEKKSGVAFDIR